MVNIGDKVGFKVDYVNGGDQVIGTVEDIYCNCGKNIVIVKDQVKNLYKVREEDVIVFFEEPEEEKRDPGEDMVTISRKDFKVLCIKVINPDTFDTDPLTAVTIGLAGILVTNRLENALFDGVERG